jgi:hypothetical protein
MAGEPLASPRVASAIKPVMISAMSPSRTFSPPVKDLTSTCPRVPARPAHRQGAQLAVDRTLDRTRRQIAAVGGDRPGHVGNGRVEPPQFDLGHLDADLGVAQSGEIDLVDTAVDQIVAHALGPGALDLFIGSCRRPRARHGIEEHRTG